MIDYRLLQGTLIRLTAVRAEDAPTAARWDEDSEFARQYAISPAVPRSPTKMAQLFDDTQRGAGSYLFGIRPLYTEDLIGLLELDGIQWTHRVGWLGLAIGESANRGVGYGTDALRVGLRFAFHELNLYRLQLTVFSYNARAIHLYEKFGFVREGVMRGALLRDAQRWDMYLYGLLAAEWKQK